MRAARAAIDSSGEDVVLVGRCEAYLMAELDLDEVIARLRAYGEAGADCLYAPGLTTLADLSKVVEALDKPVNANLTATGLAVADMAAIGIRRVSVGAALAKVTYAAFDGYADLYFGRGGFPDVRPRSSASQIRSRSA